MLLSIESRLETLREAAPEHDEERTYREHDHADATIVRGLQPRKKKGTAQKVKREPRKPVY